MYIKKYTNKIRPGAKVIDLGSGNDPFEKATVYVDYYEDDNKERDGASFKKPKGKYVHWDLNKYPYPFKDKEFDFSVAAHIAEHLEDPFKFCTELQRISKKGYIETPARLYELIYGWDFHKWYVNIEDGKLIFENITEGTFLGDFIRNLYHVKKDQEFVKLHDKNIEKLITSFYWEENFSFEIRYRPVKEQSISYTKKILRKVNRKFKK